MRLYPYPPNSEHRLSAIEYDIKFELNNLALRGDDIDFNTTYDIALYGDSFIFGPGVPDNKLVYGHLKKQELKIANIAEEATQPVQYYDKMQLLKHEGFKAKYHIVFVFMGNDFKWIASKDIQPFLNYKYSKNPLSYKIWDFITLQRVAYLIKVVYYKQFTNAIFTHEFRHKKQAFHVAINKVYTPLEEAAYLEKSEISTASVEKNATIINEMKQNIFPTDKFSVVVIPDQHFTRGELGDSYLGLRNKFISFN